MKAVLIVPSEGRADLSLREIDSPELGAGQVRISVKAVSVNRADLLIRTGAHVPASGGSGPAIAGLDAAGEVIEVAEGVAGVAVGDRVMAMVGGGLAEEIVAPAAMVLPIPSAWSYIEGAAAVLGLMTEHNALVTAANLQKGEAVLVHAASSGVGTQAVQLARHIGAGLVLGTSRSRRDEEALRRLGLDELIEAGSGEFADRVLAATGGNGVDIIIDHVGGPYLAENVRASAIRGRIVDVGRLGGAEGTLDLEEVARKRLTLVGTTFRTRTPDEKAEVVRALREHIDLETSANSLRPVVEQTFDWTEVAAAQELLEHNAHTGKIVVTIGP